MKHWSTNPLRTVIAKLCDSCKIQKKCVVLNYWTSKIFGKIAM